MERSFCNKCGSSVTSDVEAMPDLEWIKAGTLDDTTWLNPTLNILCDSAQRWAHIAESAVLTKVDPLSKTKENDCPLQGLNQPGVNSGPMTALVKGCRMPALRGGQARYQQTARAGVVQASREETAEWTDAVETAAMAMGFVCVKQG